ncbi:MAG: AAA family ATPase, partial [Geminicoccaceae bacterium]
MSRILALQAENFMGLKAVAISPDGNVVEVTGSNGSGKTSVLDAIWVGLAGPKGVAKPIRDGAEKACIKLDMGDLIVEREINGKGNKLTVKSAEGAHYPSPQRMLNELLGALTFDPMKFAGMKPADQKATLCELLGIDLAAIDYEIDGAFENRKQLAATARSNRSAAEAIEVEGEAPGDLEDADMLIAQISQAMESNAAVEARSKKRQEARTKAAELREKAFQLSREIEALESEADKLETKLAKAPPLPNLIDVDTLKERLSAIQAASKSREQWALKKRYAEEAKKYEKNAEAATKELEKLRKKKADMVNGAKM